MGNNGNQLHGVVKHDQEKSRKSESVTAAESVSKILEIYENVDPAYLDTVKQSVDMFLQVKLNQKRNRFTKFEEVDHDKEMEEIRDIGEKLYKKRV